MSQASHARSGSALGGLAVLAAAGALIAVDGYLCPFAALTGWPCPGCGLTRASLALLQGQFERALQLHPLVPVLLPLLGLVVARGFADGIGGRWAARSAKLWSALRLESNAFWLLLTVLVLGVWLVRWGGGLGGPVPVDSLWGLGHEHPWPSLARPGTPPAS